jgi:cytochrome c-type biogenesis protein
VLFTAVIEISLTNVIGIVSPAAFGLLGLVSLLLLADVDLGAVLPAMEPPQSRHPVGSAFGYGFFFGAIVVQCNPGFIGVFFARSFPFTDPVGSLLNFLAFGGGIAAPLVALAVISDRWRSAVLSLLTGRQSLINRATGAVMLAVALYDLVYVFQVGPL